MPASRLATRIAAGALALLACLPVAAQQAQPAAPVDAAETRALHAMFEQRWEEQARDWPEWATWRGDLRYNDRLADESKAAIAERDARDRRWLARAKTIRREGLSPTDRVSLDLFVIGLEHNIEEQAFPGYRTLRIGALGGAQSDFAEFMMNGVPMARPEHPEQLLRRMEAFPRWMDQLVAILREGLELGWVPSREVLERALGHIDGQLPADVESGPFFAPFKRMGSDIPAAQQERFRAAGRASIERNMVPAMRRLRAFIAGDYLAKAPASGALSGYPGGRQVYEMVVRHRTTTSLTAAQIHAIGQREATRLRAEMEATMRETGFRGNFPEFITYLNTDPKFFHSGPDALLAGYRDIAKRIDAEMPKLFAELPRAPYGVRAMPDFKGPTVAEYYNGPAQDGSRGGWFNANVLAWKIRPTWGMATLTAHEAVPGHHLQIARALELKGLPDFRRNMGYTAFVEGWAVYAETLGREIGLYDDPHARFGHLQWQALRAGRLVVDTGIHSLGWSRQQAIDFLVERTGMDRGFLTQEVDRYTSDPGQALGYMIGKLKIDELRDRARAKLGPKFELRRFHNAVIDNGALPLDVLEKQVDAWIAAGGGAP